MSSQATRCLANPQLITKLIFLKHAFLKCNIRVGGTAGKSLFKSQTAHWKLSTSTSFKSETLMRPRNSKKQFTRGLLASLPLTSRFRNLFSANYFFVTSNVGSKVNSSKGWWLSPTMMRNSGNHVSMLRCESPPGFGTGECQRNQYPLPHGGEPENPIKVDRPHLSKSSKKCAIFYTLLGNDHISPTSAGHFWSRWFFELLPRERWDMDSFCGELYTPFVRTWLDGYILYPTIPTIQHLWKVPTPPAMVPSNSISSVGWFRRKLRVATGKLTIQRQSSSVAPPGERMLGYPQPSPSQRDLPHP